MARRGSKPSAAAPVDPAVVQDAGATPLPKSETLHVTLTPLPKGQAVQRVHQEKYAAVQFNPGVQGNARFSPIRNDRGEPIPTLCAGTTLPCALMETVFHDVPHKELRQ